MSADGIRGLVFLLVACSLCHARDPLKVIWQQVLVPSTNDVLLTLKVHVHNTGPDNLNDVQLHPKRCCFHDNSEQRCQVFHPVGEKLQQLQPGKAYNLTMLYGNVYVFGRYGECNATLEHDSTFKQDVIFGSFNTTSSDSYQWLPNRVQEWLTRTAKCASFDEDPFRKCEPVNCVFKYDGTRNYFDPRERECKPTKKCYSDPDSSLPQEGLDIQMNQCVNLQLNLTIEDMSFFSREDKKMLAQSGLDSLRKINKIVCVHGKLLPDNQSCLCDFGWSSDPHDQSPYDPVTQVYHLCKTPAVSPKTKMKKVATGLIKMLILIIALVIVACAISFVCYCVISLCFLYKGKNTDRKRFKDVFAGWVPRRNDEREPLFGSKVVNETNNANVQHIDTSWYSTEDTILDIAVVHTKNKGRKQGELTIRAGDVISDLEKTDIPGYWKGTCRDKRGIFPISCAEFRRQGHQLPAALSEYR